MRPDNARRVKNALLGGTCEICLHQRLHGRGLAQTSNCWIPGDPHGCWLPDLGPNQGHTD